MAIAFSLCNGGIPDVDLPQFDRRLASDKPPATPPSDGQSPHRILRQNLQVNAAMRKAS
jgi:hypothetical protein